ncbi:unnamed protein product [Rotaria socialis]|uniref:Uncharacterized protein n=1 Tax=Rotaria socialis TaxID=392032 RepID=A0A821SLA8_9BILA|nr:unnamed protein product [Rotaria socialis]
MSDITLETLIDQFRNKINEIVNIFIINTHWYILKNQYSLMKNNQVAELIDCYTKDDIGKMYLDYEKNNIKLNVLLFRCGESLMASFKLMQEMLHCFIAHDTNRTFQHVRLPLQYETHRTDYNYAFDKVEELIKLLNTKTGNTFNKLSADDIKKFLARSPSTLFGNIAGAFFCTSIEDICVVTNIVDQEQKDKIDGGPLVTPKLIVDRDQEKK